MIACGVLKRRAPRHQGPLLILCSLCSCAGPPEDKEILSKAGASITTESEVALAKEAAAPAVIRARKVVVDLERQLGLPPPSSPGAAMTEDALEAIKAFLTAQGAREARFNQDLALVSVVVGKEAAAEVLDRVRAALSPGWIAFLTDLPHDRDRRLQLAVAPGLHSFDALRFVAPRSDLSGLDAGGLRQSLLEMGLPVGLDLRYVSAEAMTIGYAELEGPEPGGLGQVERLGASLPRQKGWDNGRSAARFVAESIVTLRWASAPAAP